MAKTAGTLIVKIAGIDWGTKPDVEFDMGGLSREEEVASGKIAGYFETPKGARLTVTVVNNSKADLEKLRNFDGGDVEWIDDVGHHYVIPNATMLQPPRPMGAGGGIKLEIGGDAAVKVSGP